MKYPKPTIRLLPTVAFVLAMSGAMVLQSCDDDSLIGQPSWLGNSIYERLQNEGNYTYTLRLIDDLGQTDVLNHTGSKTLFVADDDAYESFFKNNSWGVKSYSGLSLAKKKLLLNNSMVNNAYLIELLSNVSGNPPLEGRCMRRETSTSVLDSVSRIYTSQMPNTTYWAKYKNNNRGILLLRDNTSTPMIHFLPAYMTFNNITSEDLSILTNGQSSSTNDAWVNGKKVIERDITCKNGYIQKLEGVMMPSDNMAGIISSHANMSTFKSLLDRFCAPYYDAAATKEYDRLYNSTDSVYTLKYFAATANTGNYGNATTDALGTDPDGKTVSAQLLFDPGWNQYMYKNTANYTMDYDAGAMLVPSNEALDHWWNGDGKVLKAMYGSWDNVPLNVLVKMLDIDMISSFSETVPSKFKNIVDNTTKVSLGITPADVDSCFMGCNGVVYLTNKVFTPASYSSVSFPALVNHNTMSVIYWGIENLNFEPYLNSMDSYYSFIIPTNNAMMTYVDPCSFASGRTIIFQFYYDEDAKKVKAHRYYYNMSTGTIDTSSSLSDATDAQVQNRLTDLLNTMISVGNVEDGHTYYKTKGGSPIEVAHAGSVGSMTVKGGWQIDEEKPLTVTNIYDMSENGNGKSYVVDNMPPITSRKSTYSILSAHNECSKFLELLNGSNLMVRSLSSINGNCVDKNISVFDAFNYTVYVPTNASIQKLIDNGYLPTWTDYENLTAADFGGDNAKYRAAKTKLEAIITDFLRYHIQDNSVFIGGKPVSNMKYETSKVNPANKRFFSVTVNANDDDFNVTDQLGNTRKVIKSDGLYNMIGREYWFQTTGSGTSATSNIYNASDVVVHQIDGPLYYSTDQLRPWREVIGLTSNAKKHQSRRR